MAWIVIVLGQNSLAIDIDEVEDGIGTDQVFSPYFVITAGDGVEANPIDISGLVEVM